MSEISRFACTAPNRLSIPRSSTAAAAELLTATSPVLCAAPFERRLCRRNPDLGELFRHIVGDLDLAGHDVGARLLEPLLHVGRDERAVVLIERVADAALGH